MHHDKPVYAQKYSARLLGGKRSTHFPFIIALSTEDYERYRALMSAYIPDISILVQFAIASMVLAITPGPDMALFVGRALQWGRSAGFACLFGAMTGIVIHTSLVALGLAALLKTAPIAFLALKIIGALYLIWLALDAIRNGSAFNVDERKKSKPRTLWQHYFTGLGINILNPKIAMFFLTFLPQFVSSTDPYAAGKLLFLGGFFLIVSLPIVIPMIVLADSFSKFLKASPKIMRAMDWCFAGVFSTFAVKLLLAQNR